jgi:hypothetical protein
MASDLFTAFFQGFTGAGLFRKASLPGAPTEFIDSRSLEEFHATGEFEEAVAKFRGQIPSRSEQSGHSDPSRGDETIQGSKHLVGRR